MRKSQTGDIAILNTLNKIYPVSRETLEVFNRYRILLETWQQKTNLVAPDTISNFWTRHIADSLQCLAIFPKARRWLDLGSGGGLPGIVIAIANRDDAEKQHHWVESNRKKCAFLRVAAQETGVRAIVHCERIESATERFTGSQMNFDVITARALAPLPKLIELSFPVLAAGGTGLFHKGRDFQREIQECDGLWRFDLIIHESRVEADSVVLEIRNPVRHTT